MQNVDFEVYDELLKRAIKQIYKQIKQSHQIKIFHELLSLLYSSSPQSVIFVEIVDKYKIPNWDEYKNSLLKHDKIMHPMVAVDSIERYQRFLAKKHQILCQHQQEVEKLCYSNTCNKSNKAMCVLCSIDHQDHYHQTVNLNAIEKMYPCKQTVLQKITDLRTSVNRQMDEMESLVRKNIKYNNYEIQILLDNVSKAKDQNALNQCAKELSQIEHQVTDMPCMQLIKFLEYSGQQIITSISDLQLQLLEPAAFPDRNDWKLFDKIQVQLSSLFFKIETKGLYNDEIDIGKSIQNHEQLILSKQLTHFSTLMHVDDLEIYFQDLQRMVFNQTNSIRNFHIHKIKYHKDWLQDREIFIKYIQHDPRLKLKQINEIFDQIFGLIIQIFIQKCHIEAVQDNSERLLRMTEINYILQNSIPELPPQLNNLYELASQVFQELLITTTDKDLIDKLTRFKEEQFKNTQSNILKKHLEVQHIVSRLNILQYHHLLLNDYSEIQILVKATKEYIIGATNDEEVMAELNRLQYGNKSKITFQLSQFKSNLQGKNIRKLFENYSKYFHTCRMHKRFTHSIDIPDRDYFDQVIYNRQNDEQDLFKQLLRSIKDYMQDHRLKQYHLVMKNIIQNVRRDWLKRMLVEEIQNFDETSDVRLLLQDAVDLIDGTIKITRLTQIHTEKDYQRFENIILI